MRSSRTYLWVIERLVERLLRKISQQPADLAEDIAQKMLGPDWKERQEQRRAALNEKIAKQ